MYVGLLGKSYELWSARQALLNNAASQRVQPSLRQKSTRLYERAMQRQWFDLDGQVALVTGASRGLGRTMALALARAGADLILAARTGPTLEEVAEEVRSLGRKALPVTADVTCEDDVRSLVRAGVGTFGRIDILVNNAGIGESRSVVDMDVGEWDRTMAVNVRGPMLCCKHAGPVMIEQRRGKVINVASVLATRVARNMALYCASKAALVQFTRALALEWVRFNIQVNALCPGYFLTDINREFFATERGQQFIRELPMKRLGEAHELEGAVVFLASEATSYITGTCLYVDGGHSLL